MLSKSDLDQIKGVVHSETSKVVKEVVKEELKPIKKDISTLKSDVGTLKTDVSTLKKDVKTLKQDVSEIRKDMKTVINFFDGEYLELRKRVERIEEHLDLEPVAI
jgi:predicted  nucleic acid-binding Zn-ribbon protein